MRYHGFILLLTAILIPYMIFEAFNTGLFRNLFFDLPIGHFYIVSIVSILASFIAIVIGVVGRRIRNIKISFLSLSFLSLAFMFSIHGLSTPDFILGMTHLPGISAQISMFLASFWLWLSSMPSDYVIIEYFAKRQRLLLPVWIFFLVLVSSIGMANPHILDNIFLNEKLLSIIFSIIVLLLNSITIYCYYQSYRYSRFPLQIAIVYSAGWFMVSQIIMARGAIWSLGWWIYHFLLLASLIVMIIGLVKQYAVKGTLSESLRSLFTNDPFERITNCLAPSVKAMVANIEKKDTYTAGHTFRVTMYALSLAKELHLYPEEQRAIVQGGLVHDVGKINVPDEVLNKPGKLLSEERLLIEKHPIDGYDMCRTLGFMKEELSIIRSHHEKWDGSGYPDKLKGTEIPFFARIVAVVDVYDALTSERSYRKAWTHSKAMEYLIENKGSHFDPKCVEGWEQLCLSNPDVYQYPLQAIKDNPEIKRLSSF
ncbi:MAG: HD-GYP domain-containing protein [Bacillota bacterium]|nr:HD-GYP domain-containing protein [Bacillota bacterium]